MFRTFFSKNIKSTADTLLSQRIRYVSNAQKGKAPLNQKKPYGKEVFFQPTLSDGIKNKVALVAGGTDEIGFRCVKELLKCGVKGVMIADSNVSQGQKKVEQISKVHGANRVAFIQISPASAVLWNNAFTSTKDHYQGLDIVINNVKFKEKKWEDQVDEYVKGIVLSTKLSLQFMSRDNGGNGGILVNIISDFQDDSQSQALFTAAEDFITRFDRSVASMHFDTSGVKVLTICKATLDTIGNDLTTVLTRGSNGCVWIP